MSSRVEGEGDPRFKSPTPSIFILTNATQKLLRIVALGLRRKCLIEGLTLTTTSGD